MKILYNSIHEDAMFKVKPLSSNTFYSPLEKYVHTLAGKPMNGSIQVRTILSLLDVSLKVCIHSSGWFREVQFKN